jgi:hypothetical protein
MKKLFIILAMLVAINASGQWVQMNGINSFVLSLEKNNNKMYAGAENNGVYFSSDFGVTWSQTSLTGISINDLLVIGDTIFAAATNWPYGLGGVYMSTNDGINWMRIGINGKSIECLYYNEYNIYAGTSVGTYMSTDYGNSWNYIGPYADYTRCVATKGNFVFTGQYTGIYRTSNNGLNWLGPELNNRMVFVMIVNGNSLLAGTSQGLYSSSNDGVNWITFAPIFNSIQVNSLCISGENIFVGTWLGISLSSNGGANWIQKNEGFPNNHPEIEKLLINNGYIYAGVVEFNSVWRRNLSEITRIQNISTETPSKYSLSQNYPNPFNPTTNIKFSIINSGDVKLVVYDIQGREVQTLVDERFQPGTYEAAFDGSSLNNGVYFYKLITGTFTETKKMLMIK